jgi:hypothetical protein
VVVQPLPESGINFRLEGPKNHAVMSNPCQTEGFEFANLNGGERMRKLVTAYVSGVEFHDFDGPNSEQTAFAVWILKFDDWKRV